MERTFFVLAGIAGIPLEDWLRDPAHLAMLSLLLLALGALILILTVVPWLVDRMRNRRELPPLVMPATPPARSDLQDVLEAIQRRLEGLETSASRPTDRGDEDRRDWSLLEDLPGPVLVLSWDRIRFASREFARQVGWESVELEGRRLREFIAAEDLLAVLDRLESLQRNEENRCEIRFRLRGRGAFPVGEVVLNAVRVPYRGGEVTLATLQETLPPARSTRIDIRTADPVPSRPTPIPEAEPGKEEKGPEPPAEGESPEPAPTPELLASVAHELQTPLVSVKGYTEMILKGKLGPITGEQEKGLRTSLRNIDRLIGRIDGLLGGSGVETAGGKSEKEDFPLWEVIDEAIELVQEKVLRKEVTMTTSYETEELTVRGNREQIQQVFTNLLHNAVKFNRDGGSVKVTVRKDRGGFLEVEVRDSGIGIPRGALPRIFDRYYRVAEAAKPVREGTGLGLAIVKRIIEDHGGAIRVESEVSVGTAFTFSLPCPSPGAAGSRAGRASGPNRVSVSGRGRRPEDG